MHMSFNSIKKGLLLANQKIRERKCNPINCIYLNVLPIMINQINHIQIVNMNSINKNKREVIISKNQVQSVENKKTQETDDRLEEQQDLIISMKQRKQIERINQQALKNKIQQIALPSHPKQVKKSVPKSTHDISRALKDIQKVKSKAKEKLDKKQSTNKAKSILSPKSMRTISKPPEVKLYFENEEISPQNLGLFKIKKSKMSKENCSINDNRYKMPYRFCN